MRPRSTSGSRKSSPSQMAKRRSHRATTASSRTRVPAPPAVAGALLLQLAVMLSSMQAAVTAGLRLVLGLQLRAQPICHPWSSSTPASAKSVKLLLGWKLACSLAKENFYSGGKFVRSVTPKLR